jgi:protoporphyrinogen oxidase
VGRYGRPAFATLLDGYTDKLFGLPAREVDVGFAHSLVGAPRVGPAAVEVCRPRGGAGALLDAVAAEVERAGGSVRRGTEVARLTVAAGRVEGLERPDGGVERFDHVVSTLPLPLLLGRLLDAPEPLVRRLAALRSRAAVLVYLRARAAPRFPEQWVYVFGRRHRVGRVTNYGSFTAARPTGPTTVSAELWCDPDDKTWSAPDAEVVDLATRELGELGLVAPSSVVDHHVVRIRSAFPVLARGYRGAVAAAEEHLSGVGGLTSTGRWGGFTNGGVHENLLAGLRVGERLATVREVRRAPLGSPG